MAFSGKGEVITGSSDGSIRVWSTSTGTLLGTVPTAHKGGVYAVTCRTSDGRLIASGYRLAHVPTIVSVPDGTIPDPERFKYVHDYR